MAFSQSYVDANEGERAMIPCIVFTAIAALFVGVRSALRFMTLRNTGAEDYMILIALFFSIAFTVFVIAQKQHGLGRHFKTLPFFWFSIICYKAALTFTKASFVLQYLRVFVDKKTQRQCWVMLAIIVGFGISNLICSLITCLPIPYFWDKSLKGGHCFNLTAYWFAWAAVNIITDIMIFALPIPKISSLQLPKRQKIALMGVFAVGGFVCITSILRLHSLYILSKSNDPTWYNVQPAIWTSVEVNVGIICACLPLLRPLLSRMIPNVLTRRTKTTTAKRTSHSTYRRHHQGADSWSVKNGVGHSAATASSSDDSAPITSNAASGRHGPVVSLQMGRLQKAFIRRPQELETKSSLGSMRDDQIRVTTVLEQLEESRIGEGFPDALRRSDAGSENYLVPDGR